MVVRGFLPLVQILIGQRLTRRATGEQARVARAGRRRTGGGAALRAE